MPFGLELRAFRVRLNVEIDDLVLGLESSTLGLELWLESIALGLGLGLGFVLVESKFRFRLRVRIAFWIRIECI